jgi:hypothetical protein
VRSKKRKSSYSVQKDYSVKEVQQRNTVSHETENTMEQGEEKKRIA